MADLGCCGEMKDVKEKNIVVCYKEQNIRNSSACVAVVCHFNIVIAEHKLICIPDSKRLHGKKTKTA